MRDEIEYKIKINTAVLIVGIVCILLALLAMQQNLFYGIEETNARLGDVEESLATADFVTSQDLNKEIIALYILEGVVLTRDCGANRSVIVWEEIQGNILGTAKCLPPEQ